MSLTLRAVRVVEINASYGDRLRVVVHGKPVVVRVAGSPGPDAYATSALPVPDTESVSGNGTSESGNV